MPELPEVETTRRGIAPCVLGACFTRVVVRERRLRQPVPGELERILPGRRVCRLGRRGKYLLLELEARADGEEKGWLILHLGMSGSLCVFPPGAPPQRHDHLDLELADGKLLRLHDPRRFSSVLWSTIPPRKHPLLYRLGPEPLSPRLDPDHLYRCTRSRVTAIRNLLLDGRVLAGIGNIYANEALFESAIDPRRPAGRVSRKRCHRLQQALRRVLRRAIAKGGTTLRDFRAGHRQPGYFRVHLKVYGRGGQPCHDCAGPIRASRIGQRTAYYCLRCQS